MITSLNEKNQNKYKQLFQKAFNALVEKDYIVKGSDIYNYYMSKGGRFTTIGEYLSYIEQLRDIDMAYLMLPLDEELFGIDANSRKITLPSNIKVYGAGIAGDQLAETLMFKIDRYFDYMDLNDTEIYIQWELPNKEQGASVVRMKDIETEPGMILFGWPLTNRITAQPGKVKFSARFFKRDEATNTIFYSFNTSPQIIVINEALQISLQEGIEAEDPTDLFKNAVENATTQIGGKPADEPFFGSVGLDLAAMAFLNEENEIVLKAQATVGDTGSISYQWHFVGNGEEISVVDLPNEDLFEIVAEPEKITTAGREDYYVYDEEAPGAYKLYEGTFPPAVGTVLYERFASLTIKPSDDASITGRYWVGAMNEAGLNKSKEIKSAECVVPAPSVLNFTTKLADKAISVSAEEPATISVAVDYDYPDHTSVSYKWTRANVSGTEGEVVEDANSAELTIVPHTEDETDPRGWYKVEVTSTLNNDKKTIVSEECKVTYPPVAPVVGYADDAEGVHNAAKGDIVALEVATIQPESLLESEVYSYAWYHVDTDTIDEEGNNSMTPVAITDGDYKSGIDTAKLEVVTLTNSVQQHYACIVTNHLNGAEAASTPLRFVIQ